jgi:hypothetical protein
MELSFDLKHRGVERSFVSAMPVYDEEFSQPRFQEAGGYVEDDV